MTTAQDGGKGKGKAVPLQAWTGPECSRKLRLPDFMTTAQVGGKGKGKSVPLQAWSGPEGSRKLRLPDFMTTAQDGGKGCQPYSPAAFIPQEILVVLISVRG